MAARAPPSGQILAEGILFLCFPFFLCFHEIFSPRLPWLRLSNPVALYFYWVLAFNQSSILRGLIFHFLYICWKLLKRLQMLKSTIENVGNASATTTGYWYSLFSIHAEDVLLMQPSSACNCMPFPLFLDKTENKSLCPHRIFSNTCYV